METHLSGFEVTATGLVPFFVRVDKYVVGTQIRSFLLAICITMALLAILSGSFRVALAVILVNLCPIAIVLGAMGWLAIPLDISTVMIASIAIGIVVDDTVHIIYRYRRETAGNQTVGETIVTTMKKVGAPVTVTTLVLAVGFLSLVPAKFAPTSYFGILSALTVLAATVADIVLLPALLRVFSSKIEVKDITT
jgi:predicted RND superfamily exporter protein